MRRPKYRRSRNDSMDVFVLGGLPLTAKFTIEEDDPSVGYYGGVCDITLYDRRGRYAKWAEARMNEKDWDDLVVYISENYALEEPDYDRD